MSLTEKEQKIADQVHLMLGGSVVNVEISDEDIQKLISIAVDTVGPYITDFRYLTYAYNTAIDLSDENVEEVLRVVPGVQISTYDQIGSEYVFDFTMWSSIDRLDKRNIPNMMRRKIVPDIYIPFEYDPESKILMLRPGAYAGQVTVECVSTVSSLGDIRDKSALKWVYLYTLALAKEVVGRIRTKAVSSNVPIDISQGGSQLLQEGITEKAKLEEELMTQQVGPVGILR